jgi:SAM-dependent methyltransferase
VLNPSSVTDRWVGVDGRQSYRTSRAFPARDDRVRAYTSRLREGLVIAGSSQLQGLPRRVLRRSSRLLGMTPQRPQSANGRATPGVSERDFRAKIVWQGGRLDPARPPQIWRPWINRALQSREDADAAKAALVEVGLHPHRDDPKNWDSLVALGLILDRFPSSARVLDAGSTQYSRLLPWLYLYGYRRLHGIDLTYEQPFRAGPIAYARMDLTATTFASSSFDAIACLSVIEHGVPIDAYLREAARLLRPGGLLITSTDYWSEAMQTAGLEAYGVPVKIFTAAEMTALVDAAAAHGLRPVGPIDLACRDRVVHWERVGLDFTFVNVVLERVGAPGPRPLLDRLRSAVGR